jgi:hypothetical protein
LRQEHRDAVAAHEAIGLQHIGKAFGKIADLVERQPPRAAVLIDINQRELAGAIGMAIARNRGDVELRRNVPAEVAIELVVVVGFGELGVSITTKNNYAVLSFLPLPV